MAATTKDRATPKYYIEREITLDLETGSVIPAGVIVCTNASGKAVNGADTAGQICQGISAHAADQTKGDTKIVVERGVFVLANDGNLAAADIGSLATIADNQTVSKASVTTNDIGAGYIEEIRSDGVAVAMLGGKIAAA